MPICDTPKSVKCISFCDFLNGNVSHVLGFSVSASLRPPDSLLCRWEVACLLGRAGGLQLTTSKMRNTPSKIRNRKATTSSGLNPPRPFCFGTSKKKGDAESSAFQERLCFPGMRSRRVRLLRIPGTTLPLWDAEQTSSSAQCSQPGDSQLKEGEVRNPKGWR